MEKTHLAKLGVVDKHDDFSSKFEHQYFDTAKVIAAKSTPKPMKFRRNSRAPEFRHVDGNCTKKHANIDHFSSKFEHPNFDKLKVIAAKISTRGR